MATPGSTSTGWSYSFTAPSPGTYYFYVRAVDSAGLAASNHTFGSFRAFPGDAIPQVEVQEPVANEVITTGRIAVTGDATDDVQLALVEVRIRNEQTGEYPRSDGSFGTSQWLDASLTNPGGDRTNWDYSSPVLPDGDYRVQVRAEDTNGQLSTVVTRFVIVS